MSELQKRSRPVTLALALATSAFSTGANAQQSDRAGTSSIATGAAPSLQVGRDKIDVAGDIPIFRFECQSDQAFETIRSGIQKGYIFRIAENRVIEIGKTGKDGGWAPLGIKRSFAAPFLGDPESLSRYASERNAFLAEEIDYLLKSRPIAIKEAITGRELPPVTATREEMRTAADGGPVAVIQKAAERGFSIVRTNPRPMNSQIAGPYSVVYTANPRVKVGINFELGEVSLAERNARFAKELSSSLTKPPIIVTDKKDARIYLAICAVQNPELYQALLDSHAEITLVSRQVEGMKAKSTLRVTEVTITVPESKNPPVVLTLPELAPDDAQKYLIHALSYSFELTRELPPLTMRTLDTKTSYLVFSGLELELYRYLLELSELGFALIDAGSGRYALENRTTVYDPGTAKDSERKRSGGVIELWIDAPGSVDSRAQNIKDAVDQALKRDKEEAAAKGTDRKSELLYRRNMMSVVDNLITNEKMFETVQLGATLRMNFSIPAEVQNRLGMYYLYAQVFGEILVNNRREGDPTIEEIRQLQVPAYHTLVELYVSQIANKDKLESTPDYFRTIQANQKYHPEHVLQKLGMATVRMILERREAQRNKVLLSPQSRVLLLRGAENFIDPRGVSESLKQFGISPVKSSGQFVPIKSGQMLIFSPQASASVAQSTLADLLARKAGSTSVLYLFGHSDTTKFATPWAGRRMVDSQFVSELTDHSARLQKSRSLQLDHLVVVCNGCSSAGFAAHFLSELRKQAAKKNLTLESLPRFIGTSYERSYNWVDQVELGNETVWTSRFSQALMNAKFSNQTLTEGDLFDLSDVMQRDLYDAMDEWRLRQLTYDGDRVPVQRNIHAQIPVIFSEQVLDVNQLLEVLREASKRTAQPLHELPKAPLKGPFVEPFRQPHLSSRDLFGSVDNVSDKLA